jgi:RecA-family ATPase
MSRVVEFEEPAPPAKAEASWIEAFAQSILTPSEAANLKMPKRELILGQWFCTGDLGFIYGPRGLGKTWMAMLFARALSEGKPVGPWITAKPCCVMYVDGEMAYDANFERAHQLMPMETENFHLLHHEAVFHSTGRALNLTSMEAQSALTDECVKRGVKVLFLDNLSCLFTLKENDSDDWGERVLPWLLDLRRRGIAVVFVAHAGRNGLMRGTSKREDSAFWSIKLTSSAETEARKGATFIASFDKNRNTVDEDAPSLLWRFTPQADGSVLPTYQSCALLDVFISLVDGGLTRCSDIAEDMGVTKGFVSKLAKRAVAAGRINVNGREYASKE